MRSLSLIVLALACLPGLALASEYRIDPSHSFVQFRIKHLGYSWLHGRFNEVSGEFSYDAKKPAKSAVNVLVDVSSLDTNHAERDKHLRAADTLNAEKFTTARFVSSTFTGTADGGTLQGELTLNGVSKPVSVAIEKVGEGPDPWGGYRAGFHGKLTINRQDFGIQRNLGPASWEVELQIDLEGIRQ